MTASAETPTVTVVTPAFRAVRLLPKCLASVAAQDLPGVEHVVVDGGSDDGTRELLGRSGVRFVSEPDRGIYDAMSKGVGLARGEWIHILAADDVYSRPDVLSTLLRAAKDRGAEVAHGRVRIVDGAGATVRVVGQDATFADLRRKCVVAHPSVLVHRSVYERFGRFDANFRIAGDHEFLLRVWPKVKVAFVDDVLVEMRAGGASSTPGAAPKALRESMAAAVLHGASPVAAAVRYHYELLKFRLFFARRFRDAAERA